MSDRILITGATGFIGRHLVRRLAAGSESPEEPAPPAGPDGAAGPAAPPQGSATGRFSGAAPEVPTGAARRPMPLQGSAPGRFPDAAPEVPTSSTDPAGAALRPAPPQGSAPRRLLDAIVPPGATRRPMPLQGSVPGRFPDAAPEVPTSSTDPAGAALRALVRPGRDTAALTALGVELAVGDVTDWDSVRAAVDGCRRVVHLANVYSLWERDPSVYRRVNVEGTRRVAHAAAEAGVELFLHVSSVAVFGRPAQVPFHEGCAPGLERFSEYARTKHEGDRVVEEFAVSHGLPVAILYPVSVLGPGDPNPSGRYLADLVHRRLPVAVFADDVITWVHVRDVAEAIARVLDRPDAAGSRYIVGHHRRTLHQLNQLIRRASGVPPPSLELPDWLTCLAARLLTAVATVTGRAPAWGLSADVARTMTRGIQADGSRLARELGLVYTDLDTAVADAVAAMGPAR